MRVSELRKILAKIEEEHGNLVVTQYQWNDSFVPHRVQGVEVVKVKPNYYRGSVPETYVLVEMLGVGGYGGGSMFVAKYQKEIKKRPTEEVAHIYYDRA